MLQIEVMVALATDVSRAEIPPAYPRVDLMCRVKGGSFVNSTKKIEGPAMPTTRLVGD
jgi:hypothetical protein